MKRRFVTPLYTLIFTAQMLFITQAAAQQDPGPVPITVLPISPGNVVADDITEEGIFDWWTFNGFVGQEVVVEMAAEPELAPLIGLLSPTRRLVAQSEPGAPGDVVTMRFTVEQSGEHTIVATRTGNADGTTTGGYQLAFNLEEGVQLAERPEPDRYRRVLLTCSGEEVVNVLTLGIQDDADGGDVIAVSAYGLDGFLPVLYTELVFDFEPFEDRFCTRDIDGAGPGWGEGDLLTMPGEEPLEITTEGVKTTFRDADAFGLL
ncbi:MAG: hypothetical protein AAF125_22430, partial [Chloroflexota bacterium]